jgi:hypothetical protein
MVKVLFNHPTVISFVSFTYLTYANIGNINQVLSFFISLIFSSKGGNRTHKQDPLLPFTLSLFSELDLNQQIEPLCLQYNSLLNLRERTPLCCRNLAYSFQLHYPGVTDTYIYFVCYGCNVWVKTFLSQGNNTFVVRTGFEPAWWIFYRLIFSVLCCNIHPTLKRLPISPPDYFISL